MCVHPCALKAVDPGFVNLGVCMSPHRGWGVGDGCWSVPGHPEEGPCDLVFRRIVAQDEEPWTGHDVGKSEF